MEQGSANEKKRHHYIPVTYLNKFSDASGNVYAYRKDNPHPPLYVPPSAIAFERYYYSQPLPEGGRDNNTFEDFFGTIESKWTSLAERLRYGSGVTNNFTSSDFEALLILLGS
jgi:hypothetical protein